MPPSSTPEFAFLLLKAAAPASSLPAPVRPDARARLTRPARATPQAKKWRPETVHEAIEWNRFAASNPYSQPAVPMAPAARSELGGSPLPCAAGTYRKSLPAGSCSACEPGTLQPTAGLLDAVDGLLDACDQGVARRVELGVAVEAHEEAVDQRQQQSRTSYGARAGSLSLAPFCTITSPHLNNPHQAGWGGKGGGFRGDSGGGEGGFWGFWEGGEGPRRKFP